MTLACSICAGMRRNDHVYLCGELGGVIMNGVLNGGSVSVILFRIE